MAKQRRKAIMKTDALKLYVSHVCDKKILYFVFNDAEYMNRVIVRASEYHENPKWHHKFFTYEQFVEDYCALKNSDKFTFAEDWEGFNLSSDKMHEFWDMFNEDLLPEEKEFKQIVVDNVGTEADWYIIATLKHSAGLFWHEFKHALFFLDKKYNGMVRKAYKTCDKDSVKKFLSSAYNSEDEELCIDEAQAYGMVKSQEIVNYLEQFK